MIQFAREDAMSTSVARKKYDFALADSAGQHFIRWRAEWGFDFNPFLIGKAFDVIKAAAANDPNSIFIHRRSYISAAQRCESIMLRARMRRKEVQTACRNQN